VVGLALATALGAWINVALLFVLAYRRDWTAPSPALAKTVAAIVVATVVLAAFAVLARAPLSTFTAALPVWREQALLALLGASGIAVYAGVLVLMLVVLGVGLKRA
jgi:putative peptidoglycan lipid II flippase